LKERGKVNERGLYPLSYSTPLSGLRYYQTSPMVLAGKRVVGRI
jgi:hypothetical protein